MASPWEWVSGDDAEISGPWWCRRAGERRGFGARGTWDHQRSRCWPGDVCPSLGGENRMELGPLRTAASWEAMQEPRIPRSGCAGTPVAAWLRLPPSAMLPASLACPWVTSEQAGKASGEGQPWARNCSPGWPHVFSPCPGLVCSPGAPLICQGLMPGEGKTNLPVGSQHHWLPPGVAAAGGSGDGGRLAPHWPQLPGSRSRRPCGAA